MLSEGKKAAQEQELQNWIQRGGEQREPYRTALAELRDLVNRQQQHRVRSMYYNSLARRGELLRTARTLYRLSREKEKFGTGSLEGLISAETGNSAAVPGAIIPVLTLAVPGSAPAAVLLAAMFIHGVRPGPLIMIEFPTFVFEVVAMVMLASLAILFYGLVLTRPMLLILKVPRERLMPIIFVLCTVGSFAIASRVFDIWVMLGFGILGFVLREMKYPMAPLVLGIVLGPIVVAGLTATTTLFRREFARGRA